VKGSFASKIMSYEWSLLNRRGPDVQGGGVSAAFQSMGSLGVMYGKAEENVLTFNARSRDFLRQYTQRRRTLLNNASIAQFELPPYFTQEASLSNQLQYVDYLVGGYNMQRVSSCIFSVETSMHNAS